MQNLQMAINNHYEEVLLTDLVNISYGKDVSTKELDDSNPYPVFGANGIIGRYHQYTHEEPQVLMSCRGTAGEANISPPNCFITHNSLVLKPKNDSQLYKKYLYYALSNINKSDIVTGSTIPQVTIANLSKVTVPIVPYEQQIKIAKKIDNLLEQKVVSSCGIKRAKILIQKFRQSILSAAVTGKLTEKWREKKGIDFDWKEAKLKDLVEKRGIFDGPFGSHLKTADYTDYGVRVIRLENIGFLNFIESKKTYVSEQKYQELVRHSVSEGDIIFASFIAEGIRVVVLPLLETKAIAKADCFCIRINSKVLNKEYLCYALSSSRISQQLALYIHGATRPRINTTQLKETFLPLPTIEEQNEIARRVKSMLETADLIEKQIEKAGNKADKLTQSILAKAFRGQLD